MFGKNDVFRPDVVSIGYAKGVPKGGDLTNGPAGKALVFMVGAIKDAASGNLDRIQIVKGWVDDDGKLQERIYDVAPKNSSKPCTVGRNWLRSPKWFLPNWPDT